MLIPVECPSCGLRFHVKERFAGRSGTCPNPKCQQKYHVPTVDPNRSKPIARQYELDEEEKSLFNEAKRREPELDEREQEIAKLIRPVGRRWGSRRGVDASQAVTYGTGGQHVYCYTFPSVLELAELKNHSNFKIKVGLASNNPIERIQQQISASKTAMSEPAKVLLVFQTNDCADLEKWMHNNLERAPESLGREWFDANPDGILDLFRQYITGDVAVSNGNASRAVKNITAGGPTNPAHSETKKAIRPGAAECEPEIHEFFCAYWKLATIEHPRLGIREPRNIRPGHNEISYLSSELSKGLSLVHKFERGSVDLRVAGGASRIDDFERINRQWLGEDIFIERAGKSAALSIKLEDTMNRRKPFDDQADVARIAMNHGIRLLDLSSNLQF